MSVPTGPRNTDATCPAPSSAKPEPVKNLRTTGDVNERECCRDVGTSGAVTSAHVGRRVSVSGTKVGDGILSLAMM
jgi:hypothetical protein